jgi:hypothetical protein
VQVLDVWGSAGHVSHPEATMECWLLPCSISAEVEEQTPLAEEQRQMQAMQAAARTIQRWWRLKNLVHVILRFMAERGRRAPGHGVFLSATHICPCVTAIFLGPTTQSSGGCHCS